MNFVVSTTSFLKHLKMINGILNANNTIPIFDCFLLELNKDQLLITASDVETRVSISLKVESGGDGSIAIPAKTLVETMSNFPEQPVSFIIDPVKRSVKIKTETGDFHISAQSGADYPAMQKV